MLPIIIESALGADAALLNTGYAQGAYNWIAENNPLSFLGSNGAAVDSKKAAVVDNSGSGTSSIFPTVETSPFSIASPTYDYSPSNQNVYHQPYEQYQPTYTDSRQFDITYPNYTYIIDSNGAIVSNKKESTLDNKVTQSPTATQSYTPTNTNDSGNSSGIDPLLLIGGAALILIVLGGIAIVRK